MPGFNGRGPYNEGSMTGRKMGRCNPENRNKPVGSGNETQENSYSFGRKSGMGRGRCFGKGLGMGKGMANRFR